MWTATDGASTCPSTSPSVILEPRDSPSDGTGEAAREAKSGPRGVSALKKSTAKIKASASAIATSGHLRRRSVIRSTYGLSDADTAALEEKNAAMLARIEAINRAAAAKGRCCSCWLHDLPVLDPDSRSRLRWDMAQVVALLYVALTVPIRTGFNQDLRPLDTGWWVELVVDCYFILDIVVNFRTGFHSHDGELVLDPGRIAKHYIHRWLAIDALSCAPISYITYFTADGEDREAGLYAKGLKILRLSRLTKLLRLSRLVALLRR